MLPIARSAKAKRPVSAAGSPKKVRAAATKPAHVGDRDWPSSSRGRERGSRRRSPVRAFCSETSMPKIGASGERTRPSTAPLVSTTEMRDLGAAVERPADLGARRAHHLERFLEQGADLGGGQRAPPASVPARIGIAVGAGAVGEDEGVGIGEFGRRSRRGCPTPRCRRRGRRGRRGRVVIAAHRDQRAGAPVIGAKARRAGGIGAQVGRRSRRSSAAVVPSTLIRSARISSGAAKPVRGGERDRFLVVAVDVLDFGIEAVDAVGHHADAADHARRSCRAGSRPDRRRGRAASASGR